MANSNHPLWLQNLLVYYEKAGSPPIKEVAEKARVASRTVTRLFNGEIKSPFADTLDSVCHAIGCTLNDIFSDAKVVISDTSLCELKEQVEVVTADLDAVSAEHDMAVAENAILKSRISSLTAEIDLLRMQLQHKEEIIALHNYYIKLRPTE